MKIKVENTLAEAITNIITERDELVAALLSLLVPHDGSADDVLAHQFGLSFDVIKKARDLAEKYR